MAALRLTTAMIAAMTMAVGVSVVSHADPWAFPDLISYPPVSLGEYSIQIPSAGRGSSTEVLFLTPDGNACHLVNSGAECTGNNFPGVPPDMQTSPQGVRGANSIRTDIGLGQTGTPVASADNTLQGHPIRPLPPGHSITLNGAICGVDDTGTTACKDAQGRGFLLSPQQGTLWLPHA